MVFVWLACAATPAETPSSAQADPTPAAAQGVELVRPLDVAARMGSTEKPMVVNFWATWCGPCREEQPRLQGWAADHPNVRMVWVSLDLAKLRESAVQPLLDRGGYLDGRIEHWQLDDPDPAMAMGKLLPDWKGVVPTTLVVSSSGAVLRSWSKALGDEELHELEEALAP